MDGVIRKGVAFDAGQLQAFDALRRKRGYRSRSEAIRDLIRKELIDAEEEIPDATMVATLTIVYDHQKHRVQEALTQLQHHHPDIIRSALHVHLNEDACLEVIIIEGRVREIKGLSDSIIAVNGVKHGKLVMTRSA